MQPPTGIFPDMGFLIREDYIVVFRHLLMAAGFDDSRIGEGWPEILTNPFLNVLAIANDPNHKTKRGGSIMELVRHLCYTRSKADITLGKSVLLWILLVLRLHAKLPTIFQYRSGLAYYFTAEGVQIINVKDTHLQDIKDARKSTPHVWAVRDSNEELKTVHSDYFQSSIFIVQTPSPRESRVQ